MCSLSHRGEPLTTKMSTCVFSAPKDLQAPLVFSLSCFSANTICIVIVMQIPLSDVAIIPSLPHLMTCK